MVHIDFLFLFIFLLILVTKCSAFDPTDDGMIYMEFNATAKNTTLSLHRPFTIVIKNTSNKVRNITNIKCHCARNENNIFTINENLIWNEKQHVYIAQEGNAAYEMNTYWYCNITYYTTSSEMNSPYHWGLHFKVKVFAQVFVKHVKVIVNDVIVNTVQVDEYAAKGTYEFFEGEIVKVSCNKFAVPLMRMSYFDGYSYSIAPMVSISHIQTMYLKIGKILNAHVLCIVQTSVTNTHDVQSVKLDFIRKKQPNTLPMFVVNGLTLAPTPTRASGDHYTLFYEYFDGEFINFTVSNGQRWTKVDGLGKAELNGDNLIYWDYAQYQTITFTSVNDSKTIIFNLRPVLNNFDATISGLPFSETNVKYLYNSTTYRTVVSYKNNILNLACSSPVYTNCTWDQISTNTLNSDTSVHIPFSPEYHTSQSTIIKCICMKYVHEVTILRDNDIKTVSEAPQGREGHITKEEKKKKTIMSCTGTTTILIAVIVTMVITSILNFIIFKVLLQRRFNKARLVAQGLSNPTVEEPYYETVDSCNDVSLRAPCPLPAEELEENKKYIHYDTPYEWRIWRFGVNPYRRAQPLRRPGSQEIQ